MCGEASWQNVKRRYRKRKPKADAEPEAQEDLTDG